MTSGRVGAKNIIFPAADADADAGDDSVAGLVVDLDEVEVEENQR